MINYYHYLIENNHAYGNLAYQAAQRVGFAGRLANNYMEQFAKNYGVEFPPQIRQKLIIGLARADIRKRRDNLGHIPEPKAIGDYHISVFKKIANLPAEAWTGTLLEEYAGTGFWMLGQGSVDQNSQFTVENLNRFMQTVGETGSAAHQKGAHFMSTLFTDGVVRQTISEAPISEFIPFIQGFSKLQGSLGDLNIQDALKVGTQWWIRDAWHDCFNAIRNAERNTPNLIPSLQEIQVNLSRLMADPFALDKQLAHDQKNAPIYQCSKAALYSRLFPQMFPQSQLNSFMEASIEHERLYHIPMSKEMGLFVKSCGNTPLPKSLFGSCTVSDDPKMPNLCSKPSVHTKLHLDEDGRYSQTTYYPDGNSATEKKDHFGLKTTREPLNPRGFSREKFQDTSQQTRSPDFNATAHKDYSVHLNEMLADPWAGDKKLFEQAWNHAKSFSTPEDKPQEPCSVSATDTTPPVGTQASASCTPKATCDIGDSCKPEMSCPSESQTGAMNTNIFDTQGAARRAVFGSSSFTHTSAGIGNFPSNPSSFFSASPLGDSINNSSSLNSNPFSGDSAFNTHTGFGSSTGSSGFFFGSQPNPGSHFGGDPNASSGFGSGPSFGFGFRF